MNYDIVFNYHKSWNENEWTTENMCTRSASAGESLCVALLVMQKSVHLCGFTMNNENAGFHYECKNRYFAKPQC